MKQYMIRGKGKVDSKGLEGREAHLSDETDEDARLPRKQSMWAKSLTTFAGLSMSILAISLIWAVVVMWNFRKGLREQRLRAKLRHGKSGGKKRKGTVDERDGRGAGHREMSIVRRRMTLE
ncbi:hypothetical protein QFC21_000078 [Naganishia friedmannii]|uniref:Uncharacterized protein n=1 Tax=Naganishia friedmannii TaxID=89922 RepID=A0ACC2WAI2_9TREE|nr:hypothetical protein QFC21_000078 [Naganishia friedmannii]